ncbi:hypothetical protein CEUSTIGMA_g13433.t1 [Chlamydomonas eustigma]|uniref:Uncharacterized protein n=1 Tax=Chlamydomonas eustigma TaxID=1157962 RepID=A0A250XSI0_9CHLO|nr:hypothetical protein CEUSTIGMA_g13433.t1 [Chlamydomonas eustigma]|eukprot:GAX86018.1 hypothetical protein CEUSTIGMA_g13433.t1 [Chlamydomonas eustigma]
MISLQVMHNHMLSSNGTTHHQQGLPAGSYGSTWKSPHSVVKVAKHGAILTFAAEETYTFWSELVPVFYQKAIAVTEMWIKVEYIKGEEIARWKLWASFFVWLTSSRMWLQAVHASGFRTSRSFLSPIANYMDPGDAQTEAAILTIISWLEAGDSIPAILEEILVNAVEGFDLGPYAKDLEINDGFVGKQLRELLVVKRCEVSGPSMDYRTCLSAT